MIKLHFENYQKSVEKAVGSKMDVDECKKMLGSKVELGEFKNEMLKMKSLI